jgi:hypothetical protein
VAEGRYQGNANDDAPAERGWLLGHFMEPGSIRQTDAVEVKWGVHAAGKTRASWATDGGTTMTLLVSGRFRVQFTDGDVPLDRQGDYVVWGPGAEHSWTALEDSIVVTVRWPSA